MSRLHALISIRHKLNLRIGHYRNNLRELR